jgi:hypothetical protein
LSRSSLFIASRSFHITSVAVIIITRKGIAITIITTNETKTTTTTKKAKKLPKSSNEQLHLWSKVAS